MKRYNFIRLIRIMRCFPFYREISMNMEFSNNFSLFSTKILKEKSELKMNENESCKFKKKII